MKPKPNYFTNQEVRVKEIMRKDGKKYSVREDRMRFFFPDEWMSFFDNLDSEKQRITFSFLINTGARINEVRHIKVSDVDFDRRCVILRHTKNRNKDGSKKIRVISISTQFIKLLKKVIKQFELGNDSLFPVLSTPAGNIAMKKALRKVLNDWKNFSLHNVRKTTEVWLLSLEIDSLKVSKHMGHTLAVAEKFYVSPDTFSWDDKQKIREIIGDLYQRR